MKRRFEQKIALFIYFCCQSFHPDCLDHRQQDYRHLKHPFLKAIYQVSHQKVPEKEHPERLDSVSSYIETCSVTGLTISPGSLLLTKTRMNSGSTTSRTPFYSIALECLT